MSPVTAIRYGVADCIRHNPGIADSPDAAVAALESQGLAHGGGPRGQPDDDELNGERP